MGSNIIASSMYTTIIIHGYVVFFCISPSHIYVYYAGAIQALKSLKLPVCGFCITSDMSSRLFLFFIFFFLPDIPHTHSVMQKKLIQKNILIKKKYKRIEL